MRAVDVFIDTGSINFALILRTLGFKGKIFVVSNSPPDPGDFIERVEDIRKAVPEFPDQLPVNGVTMKRYTSVGILYGDSVRYSSGTWDLKKDQRDLAGTLGQLLGRKATLE